MEGWISLPIRLLVVGLVACCVWHAVTLTEPLNVSRAGPGDVANQPLEFQKTPSSRENRRHIIIAGILAAVVGLLSWRQWALARRLERIAARIHQLGGACVTWQSEEQIHWSHIVYRVLGECDRIVNVDLSDTGVTDDDLFFLVGLKSLSSLNLSRTAITPEFARQIARLSKLQHLALCGTSIGDEACADLAKLAQLRRLELLDTDVSERGLAQLAGLRHLRILEVDLAPAAA